MNRGKYVFAQICGFLPHQPFYRYVEKYEGDKGIKHFSCWNQMLCMMFGQLSNRESLRDLCTCLSAHTIKYYQLGVGKNVSRSNLAIANEKRDWRIYEGYAYYLVGRARELLVPETIIPGADGVNIYAFDSTIIDLCLEVFCWAKFRTTKAGIKLHTLYEVRTSIPTFIHITEAAVNDMNALDELTIENGSYYVLDRGYIDFKRLWRIHDQKGWFVTRAKSNMKYRRKSSVKVDKASGIICDQRISLTAINAKKNYPEELRRIKYYDRDNDVMLVFLTNNFELKAEEIALLYKNRWSVETFFKWIKQHLKIQSFWGISENAVKTQVYIAMITYVLIAIIKVKLKLSLSPYEILQIISISLLDKTPLDNLLSITNIELEESNMQYSLNFGHI